VSFCDWLSPAPPANPPTSLYADHQTLLASFGGIVERSNEPTWWILNHNDALTQREASYDSRLIAHDAWWESLKIPIDLTQFYSIAQEANGNTTLCHRVSGEVVLYAHDHAFHHVEVLPGCPDYTFYRFVGAGHFKEWVDTISRQWYDWVMLPNAPARLP
jgi:hypothetical protein